ncbi:uncharacterized protein TNCV_4442211 [Trichonephila clavipes]|nr:uncharacterized protein TNCV_4442211 [Trichonephila clavipes]
MLFQKYTWEGSIGLLYDDIYPGTVLGTTVQTAEYQSNEILFNDIVLSNWGYSYILKINIRAKETSFWNLTCLIGPFDVDMISTFELPLVESDEFRRLQILFNADFQIVTKDQRKFEIFFLNYFGTKYSSVKWKNVTVSEGSVVVDFTITGLTDDLDKTSQNLASDIGSGKADIEYPKGTIWKANKESTLSRKLLENTGTTDGQSDEGGGGLSVAWIVAIVINVVLIVVFIFAIIYCWLRRKKQQDSSRASSALQNFDGQPETMMYANKAESKKKSMEQKAALMDARPRDIFTIEDGRKKLHKHDHEDEGRCNCFSPECYCSVGDGRKTESRLDRRSVEDENVDDPQGYPTPSPQPTFPTPEPTPEPEDFWRPDSYQQDCQVTYSQFGLAIHQNDHQARRRFVEWAQNEIAVVPDFHKRILFSDEAHFWLNGYVNKQNCRIWSEANPQVYVETSLHPEKLTVWCALWAGGIIGPYFFKNDEGHNVTVNGDRYRAMITNFLIPELNNHDVQELWFQQEGVTCPTARATIDLLKDTFGDRLISRFGPVNWPPRSCDLTPLDYFLWDYVKSLVYADKPQTLVHLEDNIRRVIADIRPQMLEKVIENWTSRLDYIRASRGSHMPEIIFKMEEEEEEEEEFDDMPLPGAVSEPEPVSEQPAQDRYYVYHVTDIEGSRELIGQMYLEVDSFLNDVRRDIDRNRDLSEAIRRKEYRFLDENYDAIPNYQESSLDLERVFPSQEINIQCIKPQPEKLPEPKVEKMPKIPAYVGPLGICSASDCTRAAKIKCLDCRNTAYCSKRCMRDDIKEHKRACYSKSS